MLVKKQRIKKNSDFFYIKKIHTEMSCKVIHKIWQFKLNKKNKKKTLDKTKNINYNKDNKTTERKSRRTVQWEGKWIVKGKREQEVIQWSFKLFIDRATGWRESLVALFLWWYKGQKVMCFMLAWKSMTYWPAKHRKVAIFRRKMSGFEVF